MVRRAKQAKSGKDSANGQCAPAMNHAHNKPARTGKLATSKTVSASRSELIEAVLPNDANVLGTMLGGRVMHLIDIAGALAATRHSNSYVVTASVDYLDFRFPIQVGEFIVLRASVNRVFHSSMEVGVKVFAENPLTSQQRHTSTAYVTFVALDAGRHPHNAPEVVPETEEEKRRYREAGERREYRLKMRHKRATEDD